MLASPPAASTLLRHAAELTRLLLKSPQPPRLLASQYLHEKKKLSPTTKAAISAVAFHTLRNLRLARYISSGDAAEAVALDSAAAAACVAAAVYLDATGFPAGIAALDASLHATSDELLTLAALKKSLLADRTESLHLEIENDPASHRTALLYSIPSWMLDLWESEHAERPEYPAPPALARSLLTPAPLTLRVNTRRYDVETLHQSLSAAGMHARIHPLLPSALVLDNREQLIGSSWDQAGMFEIQDAGSQLISHALAPSYGMSVLDACAGAGGKTMHLANMLGSDGNIIAADVERARLSALRKRAERSGFSGIETVAVPPEGDLFGAMHGRHFDAVVVDAPCSGLGTARRNPLVKWKLTPKSISRLAERQLDILRRNAELLRPGGVLLYATCSLLPMENEHVVQRFLAEHSNYVPDPLHPVFSASGLTSLLAHESQYMLTLRPDLLDSDGFFIARMKKM